MKHRFFLPILLISAIGPFFGPFASVAFADIIKSRSDTWIETRIKAIYDKDERVDLNDVSVFSSNEGIVTLEGTVMTNYERSHAAHLAGNVEGVKAVVNKIDVVKPLNKNLALAKTIRSEILKNPVLDVKRLRVSVRGNSEATIYGIVPSNDDKNLVLKVARETPGVKRLHSEIKVTTQS